MDEYIGIIKLFAGNYAPQNWRFCDGSMLSIPQYQALFAILGTTYGGDGTKNFALPDLRSRIPIGTGTGRGLSPYQLGQQSGVESCTLVSSNLPPLTGGALLNGVGGTATGSVSANPTVQIAIPCNPASASAQSQSPENSVMASSDQIDRNLYSFGAADNKTMKPFNVNIPFTAAVNAQITLNNGTAPVTVNPNGASAPVKTVPPVLGLSYIICVFGIFPPHS